jgi:hypothetical protein
MTRPEPWLRGPSPETSQFVMPAAHTLTQSLEDIAEHTQRRAWRIIATAGIVRGLISTETICLPPQ